MKILALITLSLLVLTLGRTQNLHREQRSYLKSIYFGGGSYEIDDEQIVELFQLIDSIPNIERYQISITSHTDNIGGKAYNEWLSGKRSEMVLDYLLLKKLNRENIFIKDFGQENPWYNNDTFDGRIRNRRVDIVFSPLTL
ncbi:MAG: OmpA family protein [Microscillaceae bacterium]|jgi:outer membrane protein OmpA-like peptidoglycan-associated protein|nr:OmpA family protein [Microscillaceae bacterium]